MNELFKAIASLWDLVILNYSDGTVHHYKIREELCNDIEDVITSLGFNLDEVSYMLGEGITSRTYYKPILEINENDE